MRRKPGLQVKEVLKALTSNLDLIRMRPDMLCPEMFDRLEPYGLETLAELVALVDVAWLAPEMRKTAAAVVEHLPFAARQLAAVLSQPAGQAATGSSHAASQLSHCLQVRANDFCSPSKPQSYLEATRSSCQSLARSTQTGVRLSLHATKFAHRCRTTHNQ